MKHKIIYLLFFISISYLSAGEKPASTQQTSIDSRDIEQSITIIQKAQDTLNTANQYLEKYITRIDNDQKALQMVDQAIATASDINKTINMISW
jgi:hypothetical protein